MDSHQSKSESDSETDPDGSSDLITGSPSQENYITVDRPSGSTTIIANAKAIQHSPSAVCPQSERQLPPTEPKIHFPTHSFGQG